MRNPHKKQLYLGCIILSVIILSMFMVRVFLFGYSYTKESIQQTPSSTTIPFSSPQPTLQPSLEGPVALVKTAQLRVFDSFYAPAYIVSLVSRAEFVSLLAESTDGLWRQITTVDGLTGWVWADGLIAIDNRDIVLPVVQAPTPSKILFYDNFNSPESGFGSMDALSGMRYYQDGKYVIRISEPNYIWWAFRPQVYFGFDVEVEVVAVQGKQMLYGVAFHYGPNGSYLFLITHEGEYYLRIRKAQLADEFIWQTLVQSSSDAIYTDGRVNRLRVQAAGKYIGLYVNDQLLEIVEDQSFWGGSIGLVVASSAEAPGVSEVHFDNLTVHNLTDWVKPEVPEDVTPVMTPTPVITASDICRYQHVVQPEENLFRIALKYGSSVSAIRYANDGKNDDILLQEGFELCIPKSEALPIYVERPINAVNPTPAPGSNCRFMHVVRIPDTWYSIMMRYGISSEDIIKANGMGNSYPVLDQILCIP